MPRVLRLLQKEKGSNCYTSKVLEFYPVLKKEETCYTLERIEIYHSRKHTPLQSGNPHFSVTDLKIFVAAMRQYVSHINHRSVLYNVVITYIKMGPLTHVRNKNIFIAE